MLQNAQLSPVLVETVLASLAQSVLKWGLIFVDDNPRDGSQIVDAELAQRLPVRNAERRYPPGDLSLSSSDFGSVDSADWQYWMPI